MGQGPEPLGATGDSLQGPEEGHQVSLFLFREVGLEYRLEELDRIFQGQEPAVVQVWRRESRATAVLASENVPAVAARIRAIGRRLLIQDLPGRSPGGNYHSVMSFCKVRLSRFTPL